MIGKAGLPATAIVFVTNRKDRHWVVYHHTRWYDPAAGVFRKFPPYLTAAGARAVSYLEVRYAPGTSQV